MTTLLDLPDGWQDWPDDAKARLKWRLEARPEQLTPGTDGAALSYTNWNIWLLLAGRGWGKTRVGAEDMAHYAFQNPKSRLAIIAPTFTDGRDTCVEGESGLMSILPSSTVAGWNRSMGELRLTNGSQFKIFSSDEPERLRGPQHHRAWCDEMAAWNYVQETWDMLLFGLRLGQQPQVVVTTTPKPIKLVRELVRRGEDPTDVIVQRGNTFENAANLAPAALNELKKRYGGTRLGRQELNAEVLDEIEGALWNHELLDKFRIQDKSWVPETMLAMVVGLDPAVTSGEDADETGIIVVGKGMCRRCNAPEPHAFVLADNSQHRVGPATWARAAIRAYHVWKADRIIPEVNNGGEMVALTIKTLDNTVRVKPVRASRGKKTRAEPVAALYEQGRVHHVGSFEQLEDQMCTWEPESPESPDRMDALVWALTDLMLGTNVARNLGKMNDRRMTGRR